MPSSLQRLGLTRIRQKGRGAPRGGGARNNQPAREAKAPILDLAKYVDTQGQIHANNKASKALADPCLQLESNLQEAEKVRRHAMSCYPVSALSPSFSDGYIEGLRCVAQPGTGRSRGRHSRQASIPAAHHQLNVTRFFSLRSGNCATASACAKTFFGIGYTPRYSFGYHQSCRWVCPLT